MRQIVYFSTAADEQAAAGIADIVAASYRHNVRDAITGLLVAGGHRYLQAIEGEAPVVEAALDRIRRDRRHVGVTVLIDRPIERRSFTSWAVAFRQQPEFGHFATLDDMVRIMRGEVGSRSLRAQVDCFARRFVLNPLPQPPSPWTLASGYRQKLALDRGH